MMQDIKMKFYMRMLPGILCMLLSGCSLLGPVKTPPMNNYMLTANSSMPNNHTHGGQVLLVTTPSAAPGYQTADMIYTLQPYQLNSFSKNRWVAPPTEMLLPLLQQNLQSSGCFRAVASPPFSGTANLVLDTQLLMLQQQFLPQGSRIRMAIQTTLTNSISQQVIAARRFEATVPVTEDNPYAGVVAANRATQNILSNINQFVCRYR